MRTIFKDGTLLITPESELEKYAFQQWKENGASVVIGELSTDVEDEKLFNKIVIDYLQSGSKLMAVKFVKETKGWDLKKCKEFVDAISYTKLD